MACNSLSSKRMLDYSCLHCDSTASFIDGVVVHSLQCLSHNADRSSAEGALLLVEIRWSAY